MSILKTVTPVSHDLGSFTVRRAVPSAECRMVGPFVFVDQFGPAQLDLGEGMDVRPHPHINLATVTWLFEGAIDHRDSLGTFSTIHPGTVNLMTAGKGIVHSERSPASERDDRPEALRHADLARAARRPGRDRPGVRGGERPAAGSTAAVREARVIMGSCGANARRPPPMPRRSTPKSCCGGRVAIPIEAEADERAVMLVGGDGSLDGAAARSFTTLSCSSRARR